MNMDIFVTASIAGSITISLKSSKSLAGPEMNRLINFQSINLCLMLFLPVLTLSYFENRVIGFRLAMAVFVMHPNSSKY